MSQNDNRQTDVQVTQPKAIEATFVLLCQQYQQIGEQLRCLAELLAPMMEGKQQLVPPMGAMVARDTMELVDRIKQIRETVDKIAPPGGPAAPADA